MKIVVNRCHGGFGLSEAAIYRYAEIKGLTLYPEKDSVSGFIVTYWTKPPKERAGILTHGEFQHASQEERIKSNKARRACVLSSSDIPRDDFTLIQVVEEMGEGVNGKHARLEIVEIPDGVDWEIAEYDGAEWVAEKHRTW